MIDVNAEPPRDGDRETRDAASDAAVASEHILCVDDDEPAREALESMLRRLGYVATGVPDVLGALQALARLPVRAIISDMQMPGLSGMDLLDLMRQQGRAIPVIMLTGHGTIEHAVAAIKAGATDFLTKPIRLPELRLTVERTVTIGRLQEENAALLREVRAHRSGSQIVGESEVVRRLLQDVAAAASSRATVLLQGESGTGKELLARAIHEQSARARKPFVRINCAALPEGLVESTLFGHEKGAFTGAVKRSIGAFERAEGGTILLDEVSEMRLDLQPKLLRVLQEREIERLGGSVTIPVDVRVIATTNRHLAEDAAAGRFRQDLFYRLSVFPIVVPPLRDRREDIPDLAQRFAMRAADESGKSVDGFEPEALAMLKAHDWPGNVRELQHAVERAVILTQTNMLQPHLFLACCAREPVAWRSTSPGAGDAGHVFRFPTLNLAEVEREVIAQGLAAAGGNRTRAAEMLGVDVRTLRRKLNGPDDQ